MNIKIQLAKAMIDKDVRMAKFKISGELPVVHIKVSDQKMKEMIEHFNSIPLPLTTSTPLVKVAKKGQPISLGKPRHTLLFENTVFLESDNSVPSESGSEEELSVKAETKETAAKTVNETELSCEEITDLLLSFEIKEVLVELTRQDVQENTFLSFNIVQLGTEVKVRTYDLTVSSYLKKISLNYNESGGKVFFLFKL
ncbi:vacuolar protein sorting-associated protein 13C-like [Polypterus senegalus]|uniref:vacuolar protein sorting-associated protein 13C-like n=1 Tax=Polypterus senegalus TaxID=55291 RepID=UPI0019623EC4|nr:vacuolar protein sorting-associated protein 13C-like [Polypterus senegalus]